MTEIQKVAASLEALAIKAMKANDDDVDLATPTMMKYITSDPDLYERYIHPIIIRFCREQCLKIRAFKNASATNRNGINHAKERGFLAANETERKYLMDFQLPCGTKMRNATRPILNAAMAKYYKMTKTMLIRRQWFVLVFDRLPDNHKKVNDVLNEKKLIELYRSAEAKVT